MHLRSDTRSRIIRVVLVLTAPFSGLASTVCGAENSVNSLESPPPLTTEDLKRSINAPVDAASATKEQGNDNTDGGTSSVITEYRVQQKLYLIEVKPRLGGNYFMKDNDGDGSLDEYRQNAEPDTNIGKWRLGSW